MTWDAVVVGAGPAGALTSRELALGGARVLLVDRSVFPRWKVCGGCLSAGGLRVLEEVGLGELAGELGALPLRRLVLASGTRRARLGLDGSVAVSRTALDQGLVDAATNAGVSFRPGWRAGSTRLDGEVRLLSLRRGNEVIEVETRVVVDATGLGAGINGGESSPSWVEPGSRVGLGAVFDGTAAPVFAGHLDMTVGRAGYVGLVRLETGQLNVAAAVDADRLRASSPAEVIEEILGESRRPNLVGQPVQGWRGTPALTRRSSAGDRRVFRVGDSSGYVEPFTGEGMCWALGAARALAPLALRAVRAWDADLLAAWEAYRQNHIARSHRLCRALAWGLRRPVLARSAVGVLGMAPRLARPFVRSAAGVPRPFATRRATR